MGKPSTASTNLTLSPWSASQPTSHPARRHCPAANERSRYARQRLYGLAAGPGRVCHHHSHSRGRKRCRGLSRGVVNCRWGIVHQGGGWDLMEVRSCPQQGGNRQRSGFLWGERGGVIIHRMVHCGASSEMTSLRAVSCGSSGKVVTRRAVFSRASGE